MNGTKQHQKKGKKKKLPNDSSKLGDQPVFQFDYTYLDDHHRAMLIAYLGTDFNLIKESYRPRSRPHVENSEERNVLLNSLNLINNPCASWLSLEYLQQLFQLKSLPSPPDNTSVPSPPGNTSVPSPLTEFLQSSPRTLLIGLGGGSLAMALQKYFPFMFLDIIELVPGLEEIAIRNFGFIKGHRTRILVGDGLHVIHSMIQQNSILPYFHYDCIIIDVDSKDTSQGLSAPPKEFITSSMIHLYHQLLLPHGLLSINVVARDQSLFYQLSDLLCQEFYIPTAIDSSSSTAVAAAATSGSSSMGNVYRILSSSENVNITLHATSYGPRLQSSGGAGGGQDSSKNKKKKGGNTSNQLSPFRISQKNKRKELEDWLKVTYPLYLFLSVSSP